LLQAEPSADDGSLRLVYDVELRRGQRAEDLAAELGRVVGVSEVSLLVAKSDLDF
jgi:ribose 5-phosphate isomerase